MPRFVAVYAVWTGWMGLPAGCAPTAIKLTPVPASEKLVETVVQREGALAPKVALIDVSGVMVDDYRRGLLVEGEHPVSLLAEQLEKAHKDRRVKAVVLRINSPGGTVPAAHLMHHQVVALKANTGKPVIGVVLDVAVSWRDVDGAAVRR